MPSDGVLLVVALVGLSATVLLVLVLAGFFRSPAVRLGVSLFAWLCLLYGWAWSDAGGLPRQRVADAAPRDDEEGVVQAGGRRAAGGLAALRKRKDKKKREADRAAEQRDDPPAEAAPHEDAVDENGEAEIEP